MLKHLPLLISLGFSLGIGLYYSQSSTPSEAKQKNEKDTRSGYKSSLSSQQNEPPASAQFAPIPRRAQTPRKLTFLNDEPGQDLAQGKTFTEPTHLKTVGHDRIPPSVAKLSDDELRKRLPADTLAHLIDYEEQLADLDPEHRRYFCWSPGTQPEVLEAFHRVEVAAGLDPRGVNTLAFRFLGIGHWSQTATDGSGVGNQGQPVTVTWSIAPDGTLAPARESTDPAAPSNLIAWLDGIYPGPITSDLTARTWFPFLEEAMNDLSAQAGINLVYEPNDDGAQLTNFSSGRGILGVRGDIRFSARDIDGDFGVLGFAYSPNYGDVVLDSTDAFFDNNNSLNNPNNNSLGFVNVLTHEVGHALGLGHVCPISQTKLMEPTVNGAFRGAQFDETYSLQRQYGDSLEAHSGFSNNDSVANATPISLTNETLNSWRFLSIDGSADLDYLSFSANAGETLTVRVLPADATVGTYAEGAQNSDGSCSAGTPFNPLAQQDLTVDLIAANGTTVLATANTQPIGLTEELNAITLTTTGAYYLRVNGDTNDSSQLYELQVEISSSPPSPLLALTSTRLIEESNSGANGVPDPDETLLFGITVTNLGDLAATNLVATLSGPTGLFPFSMTDNEASLTPSTSTELEFLFAPAGNCGDTLSLSLSVSDDSGYSDSFSFPLTLGTLSEVPLIAENFDSASNLPSEWTISTEAGASAWAISSSSSHTAPNAAYSAGVTSRSDALLISPTRVIGSAGSTLTFLHSYLLEDGSDGAVLEASLDGGPWFDLITSAATTLVGGGYNGTISGGGPPSGRASINGRSAWTGNSGGFVTTSIGLPAAWAGQSIQLRWLLSHNNNNNAGLGWFVDSISLSGPETFLCDPFRPTVNLTTTTSQLVEGEESSSADLILTSSLPLAIDLSVGPLLSGTADASDLNIIPTLALLSGNTETQTTISAVTDAQNEGSEQITFALSPTAADYAAGSPSSATLTIEESFSSWANSFGINDADPFEDFDQDGQVSLVEYIYNFNPNDETVVPLFQYVSSETEYSLITPTAILRPDATVEGQASTDLSTWSSAGVTETSNGYSISTATDWGFLRLKLTLTPPPLIGE